LENEKSERTDRKKKVTLPPPPVNSLTPRGGAGVKIWGGMRENSYRRREVCR